jgi:hypothetical protein
MSNAPSISSAPSMVRSSAVTSSRVANGMPIARALVSVSSEVGTPRTTRRSSRMRSAKRTKLKYTVEPVPRPSVMPLSINSAARRPAISFGLSAAMASGRADGILAVR